MFQRFVSNADQPRPLDLTRRLDKPPPGWRSGISLAQLVSMPQQRAVRPENWRSEEPCCLGLQSNICIGGGFATLDLRPEFERSGLRGKFFAFLIFLFLMPRFDCRRCGRVQLFPWVTHGQLHLRSFCALYMSDRQKLHMLRGRSICSDDKRLNSANMSRLNWNTFAVKCNRAY